MTVEFELEGERFTALNGGPHFTFSDAISFQVPCETQDEIDHYWERLSADGQIQECGSLKDKFGLSWQIFPAALPDMLSDPDRAKAAQAMRAMLGMKKLDIAALRAAYEGKYPEEIGGAQSEKVPDCRHSHVSSRTTVRVSALSPPCSPP